MASQAVLWTHGVFRKIAMIDGAADEAQLQQRKRGAQRSADISKTASSRVKPNADVKEQS